VSDYNAEFLVRDCSSLLCHEASPEGASAQVGPHAMTVRLGPRALGQAPPCLITSRGMVQDSHHHFLRVRDPWDGEPCSDGEGLSPRVLELVKRDYVLVKGDFPTAGVITPVMCVDGEVPLSPDSRGLESTTRQPSCYGHMGVYGYVLWS
jgi:hypothetical protein